MRLAIVSLVLIDGLNLRLFLAGIAGGPGVTTIHLISIPVNNTSVDPARSFNEVFYIQGWALFECWLFTLVTRQLV
jgi:hypothetical protein